MSREQVLARLESLPSSPVAIEALWDGDSSGWFVRLAAITADSQKHYLGDVSEGDDVGLGDGEVPRWTEAISARQLGQELAERSGAEFYFPSPDHPEDECPSWTDRNEGYPCRRCEILLLQGPECRWRGICYFCHLDEEIEEREAKWTPEERAGPRCQICRGPAVTSLHNSPACAECSGKYVVYACEQCHGEGMILRSIPHGPLCPRCERLNAVDALTDLQCAAILDAAARGHFQGIQSAMDIMDCCLYEAKFAVSVLLKRAGRQES